MKMTEQHRRALESAPFYGFPAGSNMWPLVAIHEGTDEQIDGEEIDALLRSGYLEASPLPVPVLTDESPDHEIAPDCECSHDITITATGRAALEREDGDK